MPKASSPAKPSKSAQVRALLAALLVSLASPAAALPAIAELTQGLEKRDGYLPLYWDAAKGRLLLEVPRAGEDILYLTSLATGVGDARLSLGLDRGTPGDEALARFERVGPRLHLVLRNTGFRAASGNADEVTEAAKWLQAAAEQGRTEAMVALAALHQREGSAVYDQAEALRRYAQAADAGHAGAARTLAGEELAMVTTLLATAAWQSQLNGLRTGHRHQTERVMPPSMRMFWPVM